MIKYRDMTKILSFVAENLTPLSQNNRSSSLLLGLQSALISANNLKPGNSKLPIFPRVTQNLEAKVFYLHRVPDYKDADNISKPLWDSLNNVIYDDDQRIKYIETLKISRSTSDIMELDITDIDNYDLDKLLLFLFDTTGTKNRFLYVSISEFKCKNVRFV